MKKPQREPELAAHPANTINSTNGALMAGAASLRLVSSVYSSDLPLAGLIEAPTRRSYVMERLFCWCECRPHKAIRNLNLLKQMLIGL